MLDLLAFIESVEGIEKPNKTSKRRWRFISAINFLKDFKDATDQEVCSLGKANIFGFCLTMNLLRESQYIMHLCIIILLCWLGWLRGLASGQVAETFTGSANFSNIQLTCLGNLAAFITFLLRDKLWLEKFSDNSCAKPCAKHGKWKKIEGLAGETTCGEDLGRCHVLILSKQSPSGRMKAFLEFMSSTYEVQSIFLRCFPLQSIPVTDNCTQNHGGKCRCIVFNTVKDITGMLARRMPGRVKRLANSRHSLLCLPSLNCLTKGCHSLLFVDEEQGLRESDRQVDFPAPVCEILDLEPFDKVGSCICIPVHSDNEDKWTNELITFLKPDKEVRGAVIMRKGRTNASSALENYKNRNHGECDADEEYSIVSLFILPWLTKVITKLLLTFWLKVDGFSSIVFANRSMQKFLSYEEYLFSPHMFLSRAVVKANANKSNVCQLLYFRHYLQSLKLLELLDVFVSCSCIISWMVFVASGGDEKKWYIPFSMAPSTGRIVMIVVGICIALIMDAFDLKLNLQIKSRSPIRCAIERGKTFVICGTIVLEILCIVACSAIAGVMGIKAFGRWIYSALQGLVLVKFFMGAYLLKFRIHDHLRGDSPAWWYGSCGLYMQSSAFLLNAILAGVRAKWEVPD